jgi:Xaa-Pro aminopeptidase
MAMPVEEFRRRMNLFKGLLQKRDLDFGLVYFDEFNKANGRYLLDLWPQVEKGAAVVSREGKCVVIGGPEAQPYAREQSMVKDLRNVSEFMVHGEEYPTSEVVTIRDIFRELGGGKKAGRIGLVGYDRMPASIFHLIEKDLPGTELVDITYAFEEFRYVKSDYEISMIERACEMLDEGMKALSRKIHEGIPEYRAAAAAEFAMRDRGAEGFDFTTMVASGRRGLTVVGRASDKKFVKGEAVLIGLNCKYNGYAGALARPFIVDAEPTAKQSEIMQVALEAHERAIATLKPGTSGKDIDAAARAFLKEHGLDKYHLYGSCHSIGTNEYEEPFFGPNCEVALEPNMAVAVDITLIGHPDFPGIRYEEVFVISRNGARPLSKYMVSYRQRLRKMR